MRISDWISDVCSSDLLVDLVKSFQQEAGLKPDGIIGRATVRALVGHSDEAKIDKLVVALEQARWLPDALGERHVFINAPASRAYYHAHGAEQFSMRAVRSEERRVGEECVRKGMSRG